MHRLVVRRNFVILFCGLSLGLLLQACGFRLAGTANLPPQLESIHLVTRAFNERQRDALRRRLSRAGASVSLEPSAGAVTLTVTLRVLPDRRLVSSASTGKTVERLTRGLSFRLETAAGAELAAAKTLSQQEDIQLDDDNLLASTVERRGVVENLEQALFEQLIRQLTRI